jgi:hypothetical protein
MGFCREDADERVFVIASLHFSLYLMIGVLGIPLLA